MASADLPQTATVGGWQAFGDAQTGQLDLSNAYKRGGFAVIERCERRDAETVKALTPRPWWRLW